MPTLRLPAEWEPHKLTQITWPSVNSDWAYMLNDVDACYVNLARTIASFEPLLIVTDDKNRVAHLLNKVSLPNIFLYQCPINDTWARDHAFISMLSTDNNVSLLDFQFNGWGLKFPSFADNQINAHLFSDLFSQNTYSPHLRTVLEGGSIESDGRGTILTSSSCLLAKNRNYFKNKQQAEQELAPQLGAQRFLWLDFGYLQGDDTDGHIDTLARFAPNDSIVYVAPPKDCQDPHFEDLTNLEQQIKSFRTSDGTPYHLIPLPMTPPIFDKDSNDRLPATYANFYFVNGAILMPTYNVPTDATALNIMAEAFPSLKIIGLDCSALIRQHGSLHCSTMQFPSSLICSLSIN